MEAQTISPADIFGAGDPGDETQRNFRYQHAYGAILLIAGAAKIESYSAVWCEHHEDLLAERNDDLYDAFQIKTRQPERGYWNVDAEEIVTSLKKFVKLHNQFGDKIRVYVFVSNTEFFKCGLDVKESTLKKSPIRLLEAVFKSANEQELAKPFSEVLEDLAVKCDCDQKTLFAVLKKTYFKKGPSREDFDAELSHNHLTQIEACKSLAKSLLNAVRDEIIQQVYKASSLQVEDPVKYLLNIGQNKDPRLLSKRVSLDVVEQSIQSNAELLFRYQPVDISIDLTRDTKSHDVLQKKFEKGNLSDQFQTMKRRKISAESRLLELSAISPEKFTDILTQLESVIQAECDEASLEAKIAVGSDMFGPRMLQSVFSKLREITVNRSSSVYNESYETLVGMAALLSENCSVWWSEKFNIRDVA
jgi:hypothetical protein